MGHCIIGYYVCILHNIEQKQAKVQLEQVETMICLMSDVSDVYWPTERREPLKVLKMLEVTLQSVKSETFWTEKIFTVLNKETNTSRVVIHLQLNPNVSDTTRKICQLFEVIKLGW